MRMTCNEVARRTVSNNLNYKDLFFQTVPEGVLDARQAKAVARAREIVSLITTWSPDDTIASRQDDVTNLLSSEFGGEAVAAWATLCDELPGEAVLREARDFLWAESDQVTESILVAVAEREGRDPPSPVLPPQIRVMTMHGA
jgi:hypothetical protein